MDPFGATTSDEEDASVGSSQKNFEKFEHANPVFWRSGHSLKNAALIFSYGAFYCIPHWGGDLVLLEFHLQFNCQPSAV